MSWVEDILGYWFEEIEPKAQFISTPEQDQEIARRFGALMEEFSKKLPAEAHTDARANLAAIILFDQFSRNIHRGTAQAFAYDPLAFALTELALQKGFDQELPTDQRAFVYVPLEHAEDLAAQERCVALFEALGREDYIKFVKDHRNIIARFGRFPHRNAVLDRQSTAEELAYLEDANRFGQ